MIPQFPEFKHIEVSDRADIERHTNQHPPYSDFNFTSLWSWDTSNERMISELNGNLVVRFTDYATHEPFLAFLGNSNPSSTARELIEFCAANRLPLILRLVPEMSVQGLIEAGLIVEEDQDNFDYVYDVSQLATFAGGKLSRKRTMINKFRREYPGARLEVLDFSDVSVQEQILSLVRRWEANKAEEGKPVDVAHEVAAIGRLCETSANHNLVVTAIVLEGKMIAFSIDEVLPNDYAICHYWKADSTHGRVFDFFMQEKARHFETLGISLLNFEQDLGVPGLRINKSSYPLAHFLKKYIVALQAD